MTTRQAKLNVGEISDRELLAALRSSLVHSLQPFAEWAGLFDDWRQAQPTRVLDRDRELISTLNSLGAEAVEKLTKLAAATHEIGACELEWMAKNEGIGWIKESLKELEKGKTFGLANGGALVDIMGYLINTNGLWTATLDEARDYINYKTCSLNYGEAQNIRGECYLRSLGSDGLDTLIGALRQEGIELEI